MIEYDKSNKTNDSNNNIASITINNITISKIEHELLVEAASEWGKAASARLIDDELGRMIKLNSSGQLMSINLSFHKLTGDLVSFGNLIHLNALFLSGNQLAGSLSPISNLVKLKDLNLRMNQLSGSIVPITKLTNLKYLILSNNKFDNVIPVSLGNLINLKKIDLSYNNLCGGLPQTLANLVNLEELHLRDNLLQGNIHSIGSLPKIKIIDVCNNKKLTGSLPKMASKECYVYISGTNLRRDTNKINKVEYDILNEIAKYWNKENSQQYIDDKIGTDNIHFDENGDVYHLSLISDQLNRPIPNELINKLVNIRTLSLRSNSISGSLSIENLCNLKKLVVSGNQLTLIPNSISNLVNLTVLVASNNLISGPLSYSICCLTSLTMLDLSNNKINGDIPISIAKLINLKVLSLNDNLLRNSIPESIGGLVSLQELELYNNKMSGSIPSTISSLLSLKCFDIHGNRFLSGQLPSLPSDTVVNINDTMINKTEIMEPIFENLQLYDTKHILLHLILGYLDLLFDFLSIDVLSRVSRSAMIGSVFFVVLNIVVGICQCWPDHIRMSLSLFQADAAIMGYRSVCEGNPTLEFLQVRKRDTFCRSMPTMIIRLCGLLQSLALPRSTENSAILVFSIILSIITTSVTLVTLSPLSKVGNFNRQLACYFIYFNIEVTLRVMILSIMIFSVDEYASIVLVMEFFLRFVLCHIEHVDDFMKSQFMDVMYLWKINSKRFYQGALVTIESLISDQLVKGSNNKIIYYRFAITTTEMFIFLIVFDSSSKPDVQAANARGATAGMTTLSILLWMIRILVIYSGILQIVTQEYIKKEEIIISEEETTNTIHNDVEEGNVQTDEWRESISARITFSSIAKERITSCDMSEFEEIRTSETVDDSAIKMSISIENDTTDRSSSATRIED